MIELTGDAGSGKSRLLAEARRMAEGFVVVHTVCEAYTQTVPYATWREPMRQLLGLTRDDPDEVVVARLRARVEDETPELLPWLPLLAIVAGAELPLTREIRELAEEFRTAKLHEVVLAFLATALRVPTLVEIEHAHTMDEASASLLHAFAACLRSSSWVVLVTRRDQSSGFEATDLTAHRIELQPLPARLSLALAESTTEANVLPPHVLELAVQRSEGSPEFLLDLLAAAAGGSGVLPDSVEAAASARIDALAPADRALVRRAALLGLSFERQRVLDVLGESAPVPDELTWKRLDGIFADEQNGQLRFRRPALREVAYDGLPFDLRRKLHAAVGEALELELGTAAAADPAVLSLHFSRAGAHAKAWKYALMGADRASARFANADAVVLYRRALEAGRANGVPADQLSRVWESLGGSLRLSGEPRAALQALAAARRLSSGDPLAQARLSYKQADIAERHERLTAAVRSLLQGLRLLESVDADQARIWRARLIADLGSIRMRQGRVKDAIKLSRQAIAEAESIGEARALARACYLLDWALVESGQGAEATHSERALEIYARLEDPEWEARVVNNLGTFAYADGRWDDAVELYSRARELSMRAGNMDVAANGDCNIGEILSDQGRLEEAGVYLERARRVWSSIGQLQGLAFVTLLLGRRAIRAGRYAEGLPLLQQAAADLERMRLRYYVGLANACVAEAEALGGSAERALELADQLLATGDRNLALIRRVRAIALARLGRTAAAAQDLELSIAASADHGTDYDVAAALDLLDALGVLVNGIDERDRIMSKLRIEALPRVDLGGGRPGQMPGAEVAA
jgi:predicted ATPase